MQTNYGPRSEISLLALFPITNQFFSKNFLGPQKKIACNPPLHGTVYTNNHRMGL